MQATYQVHRSAKGFRIALASLPESECCSVSIHVPAGGRHDPKGKAGVAHFVEHMIFKGTAKRDAKAISIETEDAGAQLNAYTSEDQTVYEGRGDADCLPLLADVLSDIVWHAEFPESEIELERDVIAEEIVMYYENPGDHIGDLISEALWAPHPLGAPISGTLESLKQITRDDLLGFAKHHHTRNDVVIAVAGPYRMSDVLQVFNYRLPASSPPPEEDTFTLTQDHTSVIKQARQTAQEQLAVAYRVFGRRDPRRHALRLLSTLLGEGASSRLFQSLREERGLCYHISSDVNLLNETGSLEIHAGLDPGGRNEALDCIRHEILQLATNGPTEEELNRAKRLQASHMRASMESTASHSNWIGDCILHFDSTITPDEALAEITKVTTREVMEVAKTCLTSESEALAEIHPS